MTSWAHAFLSTRQAVARSGAIRIQMNGSGPWRAESYTTTQMSMQHNTQTGTHRQSARPPDPAGRGRHTSLHWTFMKTLSLLSLVMFSMHNAFSQDETSAQPLRVVPAVDFSRYAGTWYEIARLPNRFQQN